MKKYIHASAYVNKLNYSRSGKRFSVRLSDCDERNPVCEFQITEIHPYDDADYAWAKCDGRVIKYYRNNIRSRRNELIGLINIPKYDPDRYDDYNEYVTNLVDIAAIDLIHHNKHVIPKMIHN